MTRQPAAKPTTAQPATTVTAKGTKAAGSGSGQDNPGVIGQAYALPDNDNGDITIKVNSIDLDAWPKLQAANRFNTAAPAGQRYVLVNVTATYKAGAKNKPQTCSSQRRSRCSARRKLKLKTGAQPWFPMNSTS